MAPSVGDESRPEDTSVAVGLTSDEYASDASSEEGDENPFEKASAVVGRVRSGEGDVNPLANPSSKGMPYSDAGLCG